MTVIIIILIIVNILLLLVISNNNDVHLFLKIIFWISYIGWHVVPYVLYYVTDANVNDPLYSIYIYCNVVDEVYQFLLLLFSFWLIKNKRVASTFLKSNWQDNHQMKNTIWLISFILLIGITISIFGRTMGYAERNDITYASSNTLGGVFALLRSVTTAVLLIPIVVDDKGFSRRQKTFSVLLVIAYSFANVYQSARIYLFYAIILLLYYAFKNRKKNLLILTAVFSILAFSLLPAMSALRQDDAQVHSFKQLYRSNYFDVLEEIRIKTNSVWTSSSLISHDGIGGGGSQVYTSTLYALVPRFLYKDKPHPGSQNGSVSGLPSRLAANYSTYISTGYYTSDSHNTGIASSIEALWVGGWIALLIQLIAGVVLVYFINCSLIGKKFIFSIFALIFINLPICILDVSFVQISINTQRFVFVYLFLSILLNNKTVWTNK